MKCEADLTSAARAAAPTCKGRILPIACFSPAMQINLELTKKWDLTSDLHHLPYLCWSCWHSCPPFLPDESPQVASSMELHSYPHSERPGFQHCQFSCGQMSTNSLLHSPASAMQNIGILAAEGLARCSFLTLARSCLAFPCRIKHIPSSLPSSFCPAAISKAFLWHPKPGDKFMSCGDVVFVMCSQL